MLVKTAGRLIVMISVVCEAEEKKRRFPAYPGCDEENVACGIFTGEHNMKSSELSMASNSATGASSSMDFVSLE